MQDRQQGENFPQNPSEAPRTSSRLKPEEIVPATEALLGGEVIRWNSEFAADDLFKEFSINNSLTTLLKIAIMEDPSSQTDTSIQMLSKDLEKYKFDKQTFASEHFPEAWHKLVFSVQYIYSIAFRTGMQTGDQKTAKSYEKTIQKKVQELQTTLASLKRQNLVSYIRFANLHCRSKDDSHLEHAKIQNIHLNIEPTPHALAVEEKANNTHHHVTHMLEIVNKSALETVSNNWQLEDVMKAIDQAAISRIHIVVELARTIGKNANNLFTWWSENPTPFVTPPNPKGFLALMHGVELALSETTESNLQILGDSQKRFVDLEIPPKFFPGLNVALALILNESIPPDQFLNFMQNVNKLTKETNLQREWITMLVYLNHKLSDFSTIYQQLVENSPISTQTKDILLDKGPGKVWIRQDGKLETTNNKARSINRYLLHASIAPDETEEQIVVYQSDTLPALEPKIPQNQLETEVYSFDFLGEVGIMQDEDVERYIEKQKSARIFNEDEIDEKIMVLQEEFQMPDTEKTIIFHQALNPEDGAMREAKRLGIETVVLSGNVVTFILEKSSKDQPYSQGLDGKKIPTAITGTLDNGGWLTLDYQEGLRQQDYLTLTLNLITLELAQKRPQYQQNTPEQKAQAKPQVDDWNRDKRGSLPRINPSLSTDSDLLVAVKANGETVFTSSSN